MEAVLDFNKPEQVKGFELFIGPDGEYYKVKNNFDYILIINTY